MEQDEWHSPLISGHTRGEPDAVSYLRTEFDVDPNVERATLYATAEGLYTIEVNGAGTDLEVLKPGWVAYNHRLAYTTFDVTKLVRSGRNAIGVTLAGGWFTEHFGFGESARPFYGEVPSFALRLVIEFTDGSNQIIESGQHWKTSLGPVTTASIYQGEHFDQRKALAGWTLPHYPDQSWDIAEVGRVVQPEPRTGPAIRRFLEVAPIETVDRGNGRFLIDFGQNLVGWLKLSLEGPSGTVVTLRHAEVVVGGELATTPLRNAAATDTLTLAGGEILWEPSFTFHGFRYAEVSGWPGDMEAGSVTAVVVHSELRPIGGFECSDALLNRFHENVIWSTRGNFLSVPSDCPQRDERLGWTGDVQVFAPTAAFLFDCESFLASWLRDLALEQEEGDGVVPIVVPDPLSSKFSKSAVAAWGDAATIVPFTLFERFGDSSILQAQFHSMRSWVDHVVGLLDDDGIWSGGFQFGDWLDPTAPPDYPAKGSTDPTIVATAYAFRSVDLLSAAAEIVGEADIASTYAETRERIRSGFLARFVTPAGRIVSDAVSAYALAIEFGIQESESGRSQMGARLAELVRQHGYLVGTGFVGTPIVQDALTSTGHIHEAGRLLLQTECPSWLYPVTMGATTVWERWDSLLEDGRLNPGGMTSFNHYALGSVADWLHRVVAGLAPAKPGYGEVLIAPRVIDGLEYASAWHEGPYGLIATGWTRENGVVVVRATIPPNSTGRVLLPDAGIDEVIASGDHQWIYREEKRVRQTRHLGLDSNLAQIADDPTAFAALLDALGSGTDVRASFKSRTRWSSEMTLRELLYLEDDDVRSRLEHAILRLDLSRG